MTHANCDGSKVFCQWRRCCIPTCRNNVWRAEPAQTDCEVSEGRAEPATPATCAWSSSAAQEALILRSQEDVGPVFPLDAPASPLVDPGTVHAIETAHAIEICRLCRKQVLSTEKSYHHHMMDLPHGLRHSDCSQICSKMTYVLSKRENVKFKRIWETQPLAERLAWWQSHEGMTGDKLVKVLKRLFDMGGEGVPKEEYTLRKKYLPDQQEKFDDILKNAETFTCPIFGVTLYADGEYKVGNIKAKTCGKRTAKIKKKTAEQTSRVKPKKALTGPGGKATEKGKGLWAGLVCREQLKKNAVELSVKSKWQMKTINALKKQINASMVRKIPAQMISMLEVSERELTKINVEVAKIMGDGRTVAEWDLKKFCKKGAMQIKKQIKQFNNVKDHFEMLIDIMKVLV